VKRYDRAYFDKWYRDPRHRVVTPAALERQVRLAVAAAEHVLERHVRTVLDVGCGEGACRRVLRRIRPRARYEGVDPSVYVVRRFGARRGIHRGSIERLDEAGLLGPFDLIVCRDVLHYLAPRDLERGLANVSALLGGVAYLPTFTSADDVDGDVRGWYRRTPAYYARIFRAAGLVGCGMHCYVGKDIEPNLTSLERAVLGTAEG